MVWSLQVNCFLVNTAEFALVHILNYWTFLVCIVLRSNLWCFDWNLLCFTLLEMCCSREWFSGFFLCFQFQLPIFDDCFVVECYIFHKSWQILLQLFIPMFWKVSSWFPIVSSSSSFKLFGITFSEIQRDKNKMWFTYLSFLGIGVGGEEIEFCIDSMWLQGSTIGIRGVRMYTYFYWHTHDFGCWMFTLTCTLIFSLMIFLSFQKFFESSFLIMVL